MSHTKSLLLHQKCLLPPTLVQLDTLPLPTHLHPPQYETLSYFRKKLTCFNSSTSSPAVLHHTIGIVSLSEEWYVFSKTKSMTIFKRRILTSSFECKKSLFI